VLIHRCVVDAYMCLQEQPSHVTLKLSNSVKSWVMTTSLKTQVSCRVVPASGVIALQSTRSTTTSDYKLSTELYWQAFSSSLCR